MSSQRRHRQPERAGVSCVVLALMALCRPARAESEQKAVSAYDTPAECPPRNAWLATVRERLPPLHRTQPLLESLAVRIAGDSAAGYIGTLSSESASEFNTPRSLRGATCEEVLEALSLVAALGLERLAAVPNPLGTDPLVPSDPAASAPTVRSRDKPQQLPAAGPSEGVHPRLLAFALWPNRVEPGSELEFGAALGVAWWSPLWQPLFTLGVYGGSAGVVHATGGAVRLTHWSTQTAACPWHLSLYERFGVRPCLDFELGASSGEGVGVLNARGHTVPWLSSAAQLRFDLALGSRLELGALVEAVVPLWRAHFYFSPNVPAFETPALGFRAGSSLALLF